MNLPDVSIEENVPDIRPYFERSSVFLYPPARGSGMKIKVLEAMAFGMPLVTTEHGAEGMLEELAAEPRASFFIVSLLAGLVAAQISMHAISITMLPGTLRLRVVQSAARSHV